MENTQPNPRPKTIEPTMPEPKTGSPNDSGSRPKK